MKATVSYVETYGTMKKTTWIGLILLLFVTACRMFIPVAEFYAAYCYPVISFCLALPTSIFPFSLEEIKVFVFILLFKNQWAAAFYTVIRFFGIGIIA